MNECKLADPRHYKAFRAIVIASSDVALELYQEQLRSLNIDTCATQFFAEAKLLIDAVAAKNIPIDLIVMDCAGSPLEQGDFITAVRKSPSFENTKILATISENATTAQNVDATFVAPISPTLFEEMVEKLLDSHIPHPEKSDDQNTSSSRLDVLIAEDNDVNQIVFTEVLSGLGVRFKIAENGQEAVELWKTHSPAIVLMDISMPIMNGYEATEAIRAFEKENGLPRTPICAITAHALKGDKEDCLVAGMDDYLAKPVSPSMMAEKISSMLPETHPCKITLKLNAA